MKVIIHTDGACSGNPGPGGWGAVLEYGKHKKEISGGEKETTNNRMELMAVIEALKIIKKPCNIEIYTDSTYVQKGITEWINNWKKKGWKKIKNIDLWQELDELASKYEISWHWIKAHAGHDGNERADQLARNAIKKSNY